MTPFETAIRYARRGWAVIPVPFREKNPGFNGWEKLRLTQSDLASRFNGRPQNIGVLTGEPSGWLIDVDLDHALAVELAPQFLPQTPSLFGRKSKPRSHWLYRVDTPLATKKFRSKSAGMIVEVRSTGCQTVMPPSVHETGEPIEWEDEGAEPANIDADELMAAATALATEVRVRLGEKQPPRRKPAKAAPPPGPAPPLPPSEVTAGERASRCLAAMLRIQTVDQNDGSGRLYAVACRLVEHDLDDTTAVKVIRQYAAQRPFPTDWTDEQILQRVRDAEKVCARGCALQPHLDEDGFVTLGTRDPNSGKLVLSPKRTIPTAEAFVRDFHTHPGGRTLHAYADVLLAWNGSKYSEVEDAAAKNRLQVWLHDALRYVPRGDTLELVPFDSNPTSVRAALETIRAHVHLPISVPIPSWLDGKDRPPPEEILPCKSALLHVPSMRLLEPTPSYFTTSAVDFDPDFNAPEPTLWYAFLHQLFDGDLESLELLQNWFGYCLTGDTSQQKMLLVVGPRRSGKGTMARVLRELVGAANVCAPTTSSLAGNFGLQPLIGKSLAIVSDARFSGDNISTVVERLLCISGEDAVTVDRKYLTSVTMKLPTRFTFLSNELPKLTDASGALAGRFLLLRLTESYFGREDTNLTSKLLVELPGILNWAIEGGRRLRERGHFVLPQSVQDAVRDMEDLASPVGAFVRDECVLGAAYRVWVDDLYAAWRRWCDREGRSVVSTKQSFGRDLIAAVPGIVSRRNRSVGRFYEGIGLVAQPWHIDEASHD